MRETIDTCVVPGCASRMTIEDHYTKSGTIRVALAKTGHAIYPRYVDPLPVGRSAQRFELSRRGNIGRAPEDNNYWQRLYAAA